MRNKCITCGTINPPVKMGLRVECMICGGDVFPDYIADEEDWIPEQPSEEDTDEQ